MTASGTLSAVTPAAPLPTPAVRMVGVGLTRGDRPLLDDVDWVVGRDERWVVLGPNGSGKTSLVRIAALYLRASRGVVEVLGERVGRIDVRRLRPRIALVSGALLTMLRPELSVLDVVMTARHAALEPWWHRYDDQDRAAACHSLDRLGAGGLGERSFASLSDGERQRVMLARAMVGRPELLLLDEPAAGLDLGGREALIAGLDRLAAEPATAPIVFVTHHVEEVPASFTHALLLRGGRVLVAGDLPSTLTSDALTACFGVDITVEHHDGRWRAWGNGGAPSAPNR